LIYNNRGNAYQELQQYYSAVSDYTQAIFFDPDFSDAYYNRGLVYYLLQEQQKSYKDLTIAADLFNKQGKPELARQTWAKIQTIQSNHQ
jgi:tetratricopeptide (TPR) repeat protein